jgi:hypothetical protein
MQNGQCKQALSIIGYLLESARPEYRSAEKHIAQFLLVVLLMVAVILSIALGLYHLAYIVLSKSDLKEIHEKNWLVALGYILPVVMGVLHSINQGRKEAARKLAGRRQSTDAELEDSFENLPEGEIRRRELAAFDVDDDYETIQKKLDALRSGKNRE